MSYTLHIEGTVVQGYTGKEKKIQIPQGVTKIGEGAFKGATFLEEVILADTIETIEKEAFKGCKNLQTIRYSAKLKEIGAYAFHKCHALKEINLPDSVTRLEDYAFLYCDGVMKVKAPGVVHIGRQVFLNNTCLEEILISNQLDINYLTDVFTGCSKLKYIRLSDGTTYELGDIREVLAIDSTIHSVIKGIVKDVYNMMDIEGETLKKFLVNVQEVEVPEGIKVIGKSCFADKKGIRTLKFPKTLKRISSKAFKNCIGMEKIEFKSEEVKIDLDAFRNCTTLKHVILPQNQCFEIKGLEDRENTNLPSLVREISKEILRDFIIHGTVLVSYLGEEECVTVPEGISTIGERAFAKNEAIRKVILPNSVHTIRKEAFVDCVLLQTIEMSDTLYEIEEEAFKNCVKLLRIKLPKALTKVAKGTFNRCKKLEEVVLEEGIQIIEDVAFYSCESLRHIVFPRTLRWIGDLSFYKCSKIKEVILGEDLEYVGNNAFNLATALRYVEVQCKRVRWGNSIFARCKKLRKICFKEGVTSIGDQFAFGCEGLREVEIPSTLNYIGKNIFEGTPYLENLLPDGIVQNYLLDGSSYQGNVIVPTGITYIAGGAFYSNQALAGVVFPDTLKGIGPRAFCSCSHLQEVVLPEAIKSIEEGTFSYCENLERVKFKDKVTVIGKKAFYECVNLKEIDLCDVKIIEEEAFKGCKNLNEKLGSLEVIGAHAFENTLILKQYEQHPFVMTIGSCVVDGQKCKGEVNIPEGVTQIGAWTFAGNQEITKVVLPTTLKEIKEGAFAGCKALQYIEFKSLSTLIGTKSFEKCTQLSQLKGNIKEIGERAFAYCTKLTDVNIVGTEVLGKEAFCGCSELTNFYHQTIQVIEEACFKDCICLEVFDLNSVKQVETSAFSGCFALKEVVITEEIKIGSHVFEDCSHLRTIKCVGEGGSYGSYAFSGCTAIEQIELADKVYKVRDYKQMLDAMIPNKVKEIYQSAMSCFRVNEELTLLEYQGSGDQVVIPSGICRIEKEVFRDCIHIKKLIIPQSVQEIGERAFEGTTWLQNLREQEDLIIRGGILIDGSRSKGHIIIPEHVKVIAGWAFANGCGVTGVTLTNPKTRVEVYAFRNCIHLKQVILDDDSCYTFTQLSDRVREDWPKKVVQIFSDCMNCFKLGESQTLVECTGNISNMVFPKGIQTIGEGVFQNSNLLTTIQLGPDTQVIEKNAFLNSKWLKKVKGGWAIEIIQKGGFSGCIRLEEIELSDKLRKIETKAFENCTALKSIYLPEGLVEIPDRAFYRCTQLQQVILPSTIERIGKEAFAFCSSLQEVVFPERIKVIESRAFVWCRELKLMNDLEVCDVASDAFEFTKGGKHEI